MKLSAPIYVLKKKAKELKKASSIPLNQALDTIAKAEGYSSWSLLQSKASEIYPKSREEVLDYLNSGDLMLIASRPGLQKTTFTLQILLQAAKEKRKCFFFSLEYSHKDIATKIAQLDESIGNMNSYLNFDYSDEISSDYIIQKTENEITESSIIAIDYLQLLDQKRTNPDLQQQVLELQKFAKVKKCIILFISQVDRSFELSGRDMPNISDLRLPNPVDLKLFNKNMFLHDGKLAFSRPSHIDID